MIPYFPGVLWGAGEQRIHVYAVPGPTDDDLWRLIGQARGVLAGHPHLATPIPDEWLHVTVASTGPGADADACIAAIRAEITAAAVPAHRLRMGSALVTRSAMLLDGYDISGGHRCLAEACLAGLTAAAGHAIPSGGPPHMTLAYGADTADGDSGPVRSRLRHACHPPHAYLTITQVQVVTVTQHPDLGRYQWDLLDTIPLRTVGE